MTVTRFAPSPTGLLHVGNLRTAILNALAARAAGGRFLLRIDDTDATRSEARYVDAIRADLAWTGLAWDALHHQSARLQDYRSAADALRESGRLYPCFDAPDELEFRRRAALAAGRPPIYDRRALSLTAAERAALEAEGRKPHWRFKLDHARMRWEDGVLGAQDVDAGSLSDPVLIREDGAFLYTLASVVDDAALGVTQVIRGADHVSNTAVQLQIFAALGAPAPAFAHHSLLTLPGGQPFSKRAGDLSLASLRESGIEPEALFSMLARLGSGRDVALIGGIGEAAAEFDLSGFGAAPATFDVDQLRRLSAQHLRALPFETVAPRLAALGIDGPKAAPFWEAVRPNLDTLAEAAEWWGVISGEATPVIADEDSDFVAAALAALPPRPWTAETWPAWTGAMKAKTGRKGRALFQPLRRALTGRDRGPDMAALMPLLDRP